MGSSTLFWINLTFLGRSHTVDGFKNISPTTCRRKKTPSEVVGSDLRTPKFDKIRFLVYSQPDSWSNSGLNRDLFFLSKATSWNCLESPLLKSVKNLHPKVALYLGLAGDLITFPRKLSPFLIQIRNTFDNFGSKKQLRKTPTWHISSLGKKTPAARWFDHLSR